MSGNTSLDPTTMPNCTGEVGEAATRCNQEFTQQVKLVPVDGETVDLKGIPWSVHFKDKEHDAKGNTDEAGKTKRIKTSKPEKFFALFGKLAEGYRRRGGDFGTLKEIDERKISLVTAPEYPEKEVPYCSGYDYITVVGARTAPRDWRWQGGYGLTEESKGNQYRFINCGLRQLREFPQASRGNYSVQRIMVVFQQGYNKNDINNINKYAQSHGSRVIYIKNKDELVLFLRKRKTKKRLIKKMVFFCHGIINIASFHYAGDYVEAGEFSTVDIKSVYESVFDYDTEITTYACRAGISVDGNDFTGKDAGQMQSPAQKMADMWDAEVRAYEMRSSYVGIYGTKKEIQEAKNFDEIIKIYEDEVNKYNEAVMQGDRNLIPPQKPDGYEENIMRKQDLKERELNERIGGPISPNGSWRFPSSGNTPVGLKTGLQRYKPSEWG